MTFWISNTAVPTDLGGKMFENWVYHLFCLFVWYWIHLSNWKTRKTTKQIVRTSEWWERRIYLQKIISFQVDLTREFLNKWGKKNYILNFQTFSHLRYICWKSCIWCLRRYLLCKLCEIGIVSTKYVHTYVLI